MSSTADGVDDRPSAAVRGLVPQDLSTLSGRELAGQLVVLERLVRQAEAAVVAILDEADRRQVFADDGHASVRGWALATVRWSGGDLRDRIRSVHLARDVPKALDALAAGSVGVAEFRELARARAHPRAGDQLVAAVDDLLAHAMSLSFEQFRHVVRHWEALADPDGAHLAHEHAHAGRRANVAEVGDTFYVDGRFGAAQGTAIREILERFTAAEFAAEWDALKAQFGDAATPAMLERTGAQRRADAPVAIFERAAGAAPDVIGPDPVVSILVDQATWEAHLAAGVADTDPPRADAASFARRRCATVDGRLLDPRDLLAAAVVGHVRRVVFDAAGLVIDLGRHSRCFTGGARAAALLQGTACIYPGCPNRHCQFDHTIGWAQGGSTSPANAGPLCPRHNRWKTRGYRTWRDPTGNWHTFRPDGTELAAA